MSAPNSTSDLRNCDLWQSKSLGVSESIYFAVGFGLIGVVGIVGNLLVVLAIITAGYMRNVTNFLLLNLAVADVGNLLACLPEVSQILFNESWSLHTLICPIVRYLQVLFLYSSVSFQVGVAAERYVAIRHPLRTRLVCNNCSVGLTTVGSWILSGIFAIPYAWHRTVQIGSDCPVTICAAETTTEINFGQSQNAFKSSEFFCFYLIPIVSISVLYSLIVRQLWRNDFRQSSHMEAAAQAKKLVIKMLIVCVIVFFLSYSPVQIFVLANYFGWEFYPDLKTILFLNALAWSRSATNPLLYSVFSTKFRTQFKRLLTCNDPGSVENLGFHQLERRAAAAVLTTVDLSKQIRLNCQLIDSPTDEQMVTFDRVIGQN